MKRALRKPTTNEQQQGLAWRRYQTAKWNKKNSSHLQSKKSQPPTKKKNLAAPRLFQQKTMQQQSLERKKILPENKQVKLLSSMRAFSNKNKPEN